MPKVTIIIVNYNRFDLTENCIKSIYQYTKNISFEIILVDNDSKIGTSQAIEEKYPEVIWIRNKTNTGFANANNQGLEIAKGDYILFLNNDTLFIENSLLEICNFYDTLFTPALIGCRLLNSDYTHQDSVIEFDNILNLMGENFFLYQSFS